VYAVVLIDAIHVKIRVLTYGASTNSTAQAAFRAVLALDDLLGGASPPPTCARTNPNA
jgi:hypothetical protein